MRHRFAGTSRRRFVRMLEACALACVLALPAACGSGSGGGGSPPPPSGGGGPSGGGPSGRRVQAGAPGNRYVVQQLEGTPGVGGRTRLSGTPLPRADIDVLRQWITEGAQPAPPAEPPAAPVRVTSLSPLPDSTL